MKKLLFVAVGLLALWYFFFRDKGVLVAANGQPIPKKINELKGLVPYFPKGADGKDIPGSQPLSFIDPLTMASYDLQGNLIEAKPGQGRG